MMKRVMLVMAIGMSFAPPVFARVGSLGVRVQNCAAAGQTSQECLDRRPEAFCAVGAAIQENEQIQQGFGESAPAAGQALPH